MRRVALAAWLFAVLGCFDRGTLLTAPDARAAHLDTSPDGALSATLADPPTAYAIMLSSDVLAQPVAVGGAAFGPRLVSSPGFSREAQVVRPIDEVNAAGPSRFDACTPITVNAFEVPGKIALVERGTCPFSVKVKNAQDAGAVAVIIHDNVDRPIVAMGGSDPSITIPAVLIRQQDGNPFLVASTSSARIYLAPTAPPTVEVPADIVVTTTDPTGAVVTFTVSGTAAGAPATPDCARVSGLRFPIGTASLTCTVTDPWLNVASKSFRITVRDANAVDTEPPTIAAPSNLVAELAAPEGTPVTFQVTATDNVGVVSIECSHPSGSIFPLGTTSVACTATDAEGNAASASFSVTVVDTTPPTLTVPPNVVADATSPAGVQVTFAASARDESGSAVVACSPSSADVFPIGDTPVVCTATDPSGNEASAGFTVTVKGAGAQIVDVLEALAGMDLQAGIETSVQAKLSAALNALSRNELSSACAVLDAAISQTTALTGVKVSLAQARTLIATLQRIRGAAGC